MAEITSKDGTKIGFEVAGSGPLIVLVSGATQYRAIDQTMTPALVRQLATHYRVLTYDRRGRGESTDTWPYTVAREVEDLAGLIDAMGGEAFVFGMSSGAVLALEAAAAMPRKIKALALYEPPIDPDKSGANYRSDHAQMAGLASQGQAEEMMTAFLLGVGMPEASLAGFKQSESWPLFASVGLTIEHDYRLLADARAHDTPPVHWQNAIMPVLVLDGDRSYPFMARGADWVASCLHNGQRVTLADQSHDYDPNVLAPVLSVFFQMGTVEVH